MPSPTFNQFQKELRDRGIEGQTAYLFTLIYERLIETERQLNEATSLIEQLATTMQSFVSLHEHTAAGLQRLLRGSRPDGVEVQSVAHDPSEDN